MKRYSAKPIQKPDFVSVIMLTVDRYQYIGSAISRVLAQTWKEWELIIIHDGENAKVRHEIEKWMARDNRIKYYNRLNLGNIANAINYAVDRSIGEFVAILDDDDAWIDKEKLAIQVSLLKANPRLQGVGGGAYVIDHLGSSKMHYTRSNDPGICKKYGLLINPIIHSTVLVRTSSLKSVGGYDELLSGYQDWDLWLKIMRIGDLSNVQNCFATYRVWDGGGSSSKTLNNAYSALRIIWRHRDYKYLPLAICSGLSLLLIALLPPKVRRPLYQFATKIKKSLKTK